MDTSLCYPKLQPLTENIMSVMYELKKKNFTDNTLLSNLDYAERFLRDHPLKRTSKLLVKGNYSCVQIGQGNENVVTVTSENNEPYVSISIHNQYFKELPPYSIQASHFLNHSCQDEFESCFTQAKEAVCKNLRRLNIKCNRFSVTYTTNVEDLGKTVETKCQLKLENITVEGLLNKKIWLQKEKPTCHGLIACLDHLIVQYLTIPDAPESCCRFIINADKEIVRICSGEENETEMKYVLFYDGKGVSMFPPKL